MRSIRFGLLSACVVVILPTFILSVPSTAAAEGTPPKLLLVTFDGFGWNFLNKLPQSQLPGFQAFVDQGVQVRWVENVFPTVTRPNHMSLASGLYSESHGIVDNNFTDPVLRGSVPGPGELKEEDSRWVDVGAEPVWVTNSKAGKGRRSGTIYWPCADAKIKGRMPDEIRRGEWTVSEEKVSGKDRIDLALDWLTGKSGTDTVNFVAVYTLEPDELSHRWGPDSQQVLEGIRSRDAIVKHLLSEVKKRNLEDELNVILTADHGHLPVYSNTSINIDEMIDPSWYTAYPTVSNSAMVNLWPKEGCYSKIVDGLKGKHRCLHVATSSDSEELVKLHYSSSPRIASIVVYTEPGWVLVDNGTEFVIPGTHGWDPRYAPQMWPFFMAKGPAFKKGVRDAAPFHIVDVYPLMCHILGLDPAPNNGSLSNAAHILTSLPQEAGRRPERSVNYTWVGIGLLLAILGVVVAVIVVRYIHNTKNVSASYKRTFARAGSADDMMDDGMVVISDEEL